MSGRCLEPISESCASFESSAKMPLRQKLDGNECRKAPWQWETSLRTVWRKGRRRMLQEQATPDLTTPNSLQTSRGASKGGEPVAPCGSRAHSPRCLSSPGHSWLEWRWSLDCSSANQSLCFLRICIQRTRNQPRWVLELLKGVGVCES